MTPLRTSLTLIQAPFRKHLHRRIMRKEWFHESFYSIRLATTLPIEVFLKTKFKTRESNFGMQIQMQLFKFINLKECNIFANFALPILL